MKRFTRILLLLFALVAALTANGMSAGARSAEEKAEVARLKKNLELIHRQGRPTSDDYIPTLQRLYADMFFHDICPKGKRENVRRLVNTQYLLNELAFVWNDLLRWKDITAEEYDSVCYRYVACVPEDFDCLVINPQHSVYEDSPESFAYFASRDYSAYYDFLHAHHQLLRRVGDLRYDELFVELIGGLQWKAATYMYEHNGAKDPYHWLDSAYAYSMEWIRAHPVSGVSDLSHISTNLLAVMCRISKEGYTQDVRAYLNRLYDVCSEAFNSRRDHYTSDEENEAFATAFYGTRWYMADILTLQAEGELLNGNAGQAVALQRQACEIAEELEMEVFVNSDEYYGELMMIAIAANDMNTVEELKERGLVNLSQMEYWKCFDMRYNATPYRNKLEKMLMKNVQKLFPAQLRRKYSTKVQEIRSEDFWVAMEESGPYAYEDDDDEDEWEEFYEGEEGDFDWYPGKVKIKDLYYVLDENEHTACVAGFECREASDDEEEEGSAQPMKLKKALIPERVRHEGKIYIVRSIANAFNGCDAVTSVSIPATVTDISLYAFSHARNLTKIIVASANPIYCSVDGVLMTKDKSRLVTFPCGRTDSYVIPSTVNTVGKDAFYGCQLTSVEVPAGVERIGANAFNDCKLQSVVWNVERCTLGAAKKGVLAKSVTSVTFGKDVQVIPKKFCMDLTNLTELTIPDNVIRIERNAFSGCHALCCTIQSGNISIDSDAFEGVPNIVYHGHNDDAGEDEDDMSFGALSVNGFIHGDFVYSDSTMTELLAGIGQHYDGRTLVIPDGVKRIGSRAFFHSEPGRVVIPESVTHIGSQVFGHSIRTVVWNARNCEDLENEKHLPFTYVRDSFIFGNQVEHVPAFMCFDVGVKTLVLPEGVKSIGIYAFAVCNHMTGIRIPSSVDSIGYAVFCGCGSLTSIDVDDNNPRYCSVDGVLMTKDRSTIVAYPSGRKDRYDIPQGVTHLADHAFDYCRELEGISISGSVTDIGRYAFNHCENLTHIIIPQGVKSVGQNAFNGCDSLTSVRWNARRCADFLSYHASPFYTVCEQITSFDFDDAVEAVPDYLCIDMENLERLRLPTALTSIGTQAFMNCSALTEITFPKRLQTIGGMAFDGCTGLQAVTCLASTPPEMRTVTFEENENLYGVFFVVGNAIQHIPLYVPAANVEAYKQAAQWKDFEAILPCGK